MEISLLVVLELFVGFIALISIWHFYCRVSIPGIPLKDANILITGGSEGIGFSVAKACVQRGANVAILARNKQKLSNAAQQLQKNAKKQKILTISADVSDYKLMEKEIIAVFDDAKWTELHCVVCNAGVEQVSSFENTSMADSHRVMNINFFGVLNTIKITLPYLKRNKLQQNAYGRVLITCSLLGLIGMAYYSSYSASKWALRGFVESIHAELAAMNIYTSIVYPADVRTPSLVREKKVNIPQSVRDLSAAADTFEADDVGRDMMLMIEKGTYNRSWGVEGWLLKNETAGFGITHSLMDTITEVLGGGLLRAIAMYYIQDQYRTCRDSFCKKAEAKSES